MPKKITGYKLDVHVDTENDSVSKNELYDIVDGVAANIGADYGEDVSYPVMDVNGNKIGHVDLEYYREDSEEDEEE